MYVLREEERFIEKATCCGKKLASLNFCLLTMGKKKKVFYAFCGIRMSEKNQSSDQREDKETGKTVKGNLFLVISTPNIP